MKEVITPKITLGKSVRIEVTKSISINIDKPLSYVDLLIIFWDAVLCVSLD